MQNSEMNTLMEKAEQEIQANIDSVSDVTILVVTIDAELQKNEKRLNEFKQYWDAFAKGVNNAWRTPIVNADAIDNVNIAKTNLSNGNLYIVITTSDHFSVTLVKPKDFTFEQLVAYLEQKEKQCDDGEKD